MDIVKWNTAVECGDFRASFCLLHAYIAQSKYTLL